MDLLRIYSPVLRFALVGSIGFLVDAGILILIVKSGVNVHPARMASFAVAVCVTYALNRRFTFKSAAAGLGALKAYGAVQIAGNLINMGVFTLLLLAWPSLVAFPVLP